MARLLLLVLATAALGAPGSQAPLASSTAPLIVLMTDYGTKDFYVGALHGAIYNVCPGVRLAGLRGGAAGVRGTRQGAGAAPDHPARGDAGRDPRLRAGGGPLRQPHHQHPAGCDPESGGESRPAT